MQLHFTRRHLVALLLILLLLPGLSFTSLGANEPALGPGAKDAARQGALSLTLYLTDALHLSQAQSLAVRECTRRELEQAALKADADRTTGMPLQVEQQYEAAMQRILTPAQFNAFRRLERGPLVTSTLSRVLASR